MKRNFLILFMLVITSSVLAQLSGGIKGGLNLSNQNFDIEDFSLSPDSRTGFHIGGYLRISPTKNFAIQPELLFNSVGITADDYSETWNYISVPVMFLYRPVEIFNIHGGPQVGFLMNAEADFDGDKEDIEETNALDFGVAFGAGLDLPMGLGFSLRYYLGLGNVYNFEDVDGFDEDARVTNRSFMVSVTYKIFGE